MILSISYLVAATALATFLAFIVHGGCRKVNLRSVLDSLTQKRVASSSSTSVTSVPQTSSSHVSSNTCPTPSAPPLVVPCEVCFSSSTLRCSRCRLARYCSGKCQIIHWKHGHREECRPLPAPCQQNDAGSCSSNQKPNIRGVEDGHATEDHVGNEKIAQNPGPSTEAGSFEGDDGKSSETVRLSDPDVLMCPICFENLSIPVYQCKNGHIMCSVCSATVKGFCPTCNSQSEHYRCRGIEKILESAKSVCPNKKYGCTMIIPWIHRCAHESACLFPPCCCPIRNCGFVGTPLQLSTHVRREHNNVIGFSHGKSFWASLSRDLGSRVLVEEKEGTVFVLHNQRRADGNAFSITAIGFERFFYGIKVKHGERTQSVKAPTDIVQHFQVDHVPNHYLFVPGSYFNSSDKIELAIKVYAQGKRR